MFCKYSQLPAIMFFNFLLIFLNFLPKFLNVLPICLNMLQKICNVLYCTYVSKCSANTVLFNVLRIFLHALPLFLRILLTTVLILFCQYFYLQYSICTVCNDSFCLPDPGRGWPAACRWTYPWSGGAARDACPT